MRCGVVQRLTLRALVAALVLAGPACGIGEKQGHADRVHASLAKAGAEPGAGTASYELVLGDGGLEDLEADERQRVEAALGAAGASGNPSIVVEVGFAVPDRRARASFPGGEVERATVFHDTNLFVRRQNARATERRTWAKLDLAEVVENERPLDTREMTPGQVLSSAASTINPVYVLELVRGALAGSIEVRGNETAGGVESTRYDANVSFDKALTELEFDDEEREVRLRLFRLLGARKDVVPASVWVDAEGRLRRVRVELDQQISRRRTNKLLVTVDITSFGSGVALEGPAEEATVTYERFGRLVRSALPEGA